MHYQYGNCCWPGQNRVCNLRQEMLQKAGKSCPCNEYNWRWTSKKKKLLKICIQCRYAECCYTECHGTFWTSLPDSRMIEKERKNRDRITEGIQMALQHSAEWQSAQNFVSSITMLSVIILSVVVPFEYPPWFYRNSFFLFQSFKKQNGGLLTFCLQSFCLQTSCLLINK